MMHVKKLFVTLAMTLAFIALICVTGNAHAATGILFFTPNSYTTQVEFQCTEGPGCENIEYQVEDAGNYIRRQKVMTNKDLGGYSEFNAITRRDQSKLIATSNRDENGMPNHETRMWMGGTLIISKLDNSAPTVKLPIYLWLWEYGVSRCMGRFADICISHGVELYPVWTLSSNYTYHGSQGFQKLEYWLGKFNLTGQNPFVFIAAAHDGQDKKEFFVGYSD